VADRQTYGQQHRLRRSSITPNKSMTIVCTAKDSLRYLVQDSLANFTQMVVDACHSTLECEANLKWGTDVIYSPFKCVLTLSYFVTDLSSIFDCPSVPDLSTSGQG